MPDEVLDPFSFELVFTGLCMFHATEQEGIAFLVNAVDPVRFREDPEITNLASAIHPHFPRLSYHMSQQLRGGTETPRRPDRIFFSPAGEEIGVCHLEEEDLTLVPTGTAPFQPGPLDEAPSLSFLASTLASTSFEPSPLLSAALPNSAVTTRFRFSEGSLETLRVSFAGAQETRIEFRTINTITDSPDGPELTIAEQIVLRLDGLTAPVEIRSDRDRPLRLRPDRDPSRASRPVTVNLSNLHDEFHSPAEAGFDFLWLYELLSFSDPRPSRRDLPIPFVLNHPTDDLTGTSGVCPPVKG
jgi:hypothetical protein